jgi:hypothetical protein
MFEDIFGFNNPFANDPNLTMIDRQQAEEAANKSGLTDQKMLRHFYDTFLKARSVRNQNNAPKI